MILVYLFVCLVFAAFFAGMETGLLAVNRTLIQDRSRRGIMYARACEFLLSKPERLLGTTLIGHNIGNVAAAVIVTNYFQSIGQENLTWVAIISMTLVFLIFDDFIPKTLLRRYANTVSARLAPVLMGFYTLFIPPYLVLNSVVKALLVFTGKHKAQREELKTKRDLRFIVNLTGKEAGLPVEHQKIIEDILHFRDQIAREVMVPYHKLPVLWANQCALDAAKLSIDTGHRYIPVSAQRTDNMIGYVDTSELMWTDKTMVKDLVKQAVFYPEAKRIPDLLLDMNRRNLRVVFLVDEYGAIAGMITPSQIIADVVHYTPEEGPYTEEILKIGPNRFLVDAEMDLEDLSRELGVSLGRSVNSTVGGYVSERMGTIPQVGELYKEHGYVFQIAERDDRHITRMEIVHEQDHGHDGAQTPKAREA